MNYFLVSQRNQATENSQKKLTAPDDKPHSYIKDYARRGDLIVQYNSSTSCISGVAQVKSNPYVTGNTIYIDIEIYDFGKVLERDLWAKTMRQLQHGQKTPVNENLTINSRYLQKMNADCYNFVLNKAEEFEENRAIVASIRSLSPAAENNPPKDDKTFEQEQTFQTIFFGAPGTGKSHKIDYNLFEDKDGNLIGKGIKEIPEDRKFRTTFHPDYDYAQFVGAYKPKKEGEKITYSFVPQVFAKAYAAAWKLYLQRDSRDSIGVSPFQNDSGKDIQVYLVIEEINRGNCAQIFGDIFQLLDRDSDGFSQYSIDADCDFATWLKEDSILKTVWSEYETKVGDGKLKLPPNLNILATMNTSDQSLFPMDSAFKRRFDWEYVPIKYAKDSDCGEDWNADKFTIDGNGLTFKWLDFLKKVNADIYKVTESEDKQMGEFFIKPKRDDMKITLDEFRSKVLFYLWDSVYKDEHDSKLVFHFPYPEKGSDVTFQRLFSGDFVEILKQMLKNLDETYKDGEFKDLKILEE